MDKTTAPPPKPQPPVLPEPVEPVYIQLDRPWVGKPKPEPKPQGSRER